MKKMGLITAITVALATGSLGLYAGEVDFQPVWGSNANSNFSGAEVAINDNNARITSLENLVSQLVSSNQELQQQNDDLQARILELEENSGGVAGLANYVSVEVDEYGYPAVVFDSVNVHIRNGNPSTLAFDGEGSNGLGNLIVGYNTASDSGLLLGPQCSGGFFEDMRDGEVSLPTQETCEAEGYVWASSHKTGSHNVIVGPKHSYTGANSIVGGVGNMALDGLNLITGSYNLGAFAGTALSGIDNRAYYNGTIVGGGGGETGFVGMIIGGNGNTALNYSVVVGGGDEVGDASEVLVNGVTIE